MERYSAKLTVQKITGSLRINALTRAMFYLPLPLVVGVGHRFTGNYSGKELQREMQLQCTKFSLLVSIMLTHAVSKFQAILLQQYTFPTLWLIVLHSLYRKGLGFYSNYTVASQVCLLIFLYAPLIVNQNLYCLSPQTALTNGHRF